MFIVGTRRVSTTPNLTIELETLVRALRDSEILALGIIPAICVKNSYEDLAEEQRALA